MILSKKQTIALDYLEDNKTNELLFGGGAGGGKSILGCYWQIKNRLKYPGSRGLIGRSKLKTLKETTLNSFFIVAKMQGLTANIHYRYNQQHGHIKFFNDSEILLKDLFSYPSDPDFDELGSLEITDAFIDEANQISRKAKQIVRSRIRYNLQENNLIPKMLMTCNPSKNWTYSDFFKADRDGKLPYNYKFIQSLVVDNPNIDPSYLNNLKQLDQQSKERLLFGNWDYDDDPSSLCDYDSICDAFTNTHVKDGIKRISADLAMQGRDKFIAGSWSGRKVRVAIDKKKSTGKEIEEDLKDLKNKDLVSNGNIVADSDGLGAYLESYIRNIRTFHGGSSAKDNKQFGNLKDECGFKLAELINKKDIHIICTREQEEEIKSEISICLKRDNVDIDKKKLIKKEKMKELLGHSPDYLDMLLMGMIFQIDGGKMDIR